jgi:arylsulfatase
VPDDSLAEYQGKFPETPYRGKTYQPHDTPRAAYAAMVTRMDRSVGRLMDLLKELKLDDNTLILFSSDNGAIHNHSGTDAKFFGSLGHLRGMKGSLYEGGIRTPLLARWPTRIKPGSTSDLPTANWDLLPTVWEAVGIAPLKDIDGLSLLPTLLAQGEQKRHEFLYWEFPGYGGQQAVREGNWKAVRQNLGKGNLTTELYDLAADPSESKDVAAANPEIVKRLEARMREQHTPSAEFPLQTVDGRVKK